MSFENKEVVIIKGSGEHVRFYETFYETISHKAKCDKWTQSLLEYLLYKGLWCREGQKCAT